ncbi:MAG: class I SAM-dependent methyltransferase [Thermoplasmata archaeon]|jgi:SAM-dependent methyltransferase
MSLDELQRQWDELAHKDPMWWTLSTPGKEDCRWDAEEYFRTGREEAGELKRWLGSMGVVVSPGEALDFGCGMGRVTQGLADWFTEVIGVDISPKMIELAQANNRMGSRCRFILNASDNLGRFGDGTFDLIYSNRVLQHIPSKIVPVYLREFIRVLSEHGALVVQYPGPPENRLFGWIPTRLLNLLAILYRKLTARLGATRKPGWDFHWMRESEMRALLTRSGGYLVKTQALPPVLARPSSLSNSLYLIRKVTLKSH